MALLDAPVTHDVRGAPRSLAAQAAQLKFLLPTMPLVVILSTTKPPFRSRCTNLVTL